MTDQWTDQLSDYLDGELDAADRAALEEHLAVCANCTSTLDELREVLARAATISSRPPAVDLWIGIEARLNRVTPVLTALGARIAPRVSFTLPQLVAAGLALMVMSGGAVWVLQHGGRATDLAARGGDERSRRGHVAGVADGSAL